MRNKLIISFFCVLLAVCALAGLFIPDKYYSEREKRTLAQKPAFIAADFFSGKFGGKLETYLADQVPLRDKWITLKAYLELGIGKHESGGVYICKDNCLMDKFTSYSQKQLAANAEALAELQKKLAEATLMAVQKLQQAAASGHFTAIVFALVSMVYKAELAEASVEASVKDALKQWQQVLLQKVPGTLSVDGKDIVPPDDGDGEAMLLPIKLAAAENISALARCTNLKAAAKASEAVKKQRRQLHKQAVLVAWQEQLQNICDASTSKLVYREAGMILGYLLAKK